MRWVFALFGWGFFVVVEEVFVEGVEVGGIVELGEFEDGHGGAAGDFGFFGVAEFDDFHDGFAGVVEGEGLVVKGEEVAFELEGVAFGVVFFELFPGLFGEVDGIGEAFGDFHFGKDGVHVGFAVGENFGDGW